MPTRVVVLVVAALALQAGTAGAQSTGLDDLVGARAGQAEGEVQRRGYRNVGGQQGDDRTYSYWWNDDRRQCVSIATSDGRYSSITPTTAPDCQQDAGNEGRRSADRRHDDRRNRAYVAVDDLSRVCRNEAAASFDRRPSEVTANASIKQRNGYLVQGWYDRGGGKGTRFFTCRFDIDGRFLTVG